MTLLLIAGTGFIGRHVTWRLVERRHAGALRRTIAWDEEARDT